MMSPCRRDVSRWRRAVRLYPDHVVFCGPGATVLADGGAPDGLVGEIRPAVPAPPPFLLAPGRRRADCATTRRSGARALARCLGDVLARVPEDATPNYLTDEKYAS